MNEECESSYTNIESKINYKMQTINIGYQKMSPQQNMHNVIKLCKCGSEEVALQLYM